jgi:RimJ/RimL family protein N-acetyltransferase
VSIVFETERLRAVPWREEHAEPAHAAYSQPDFVRYLGNSQPHPDLGHTRRWIARINELNAAGRPDGFWAVEVRGDGEHEIGWHVFPAHQSNGYGKRGRTSRYYDVEVELFTVTRDEFAEAGPAAPRR